MKTLWKIVIGIGSVLVGAAVVETVYRKFSSNPKITRTLTSPTGIYFEVYRDPNDPRNIVWSEDGKEEKKVTTDFLRLAAGNVIRKDAGVDVQTQIDIPSDVLVEAVPIEGTGAMHGILIENVKQAQELRATKNAVWLIGLRPGNPEISRADEYIAVRVFDRKDGKFTKVDLYKAFKDEDGSVVETAPTKAALLAKLS